MEYVTSRNFILPATIPEMTAGFWFNMWKSKLWPYEELIKGDLLYWYESPSKSLVWKTRVKDIERFKYEDKILAGKKMEKRFGVFNRQQAYFANAPEAGFCLAYNVSPLQRINLLKPTGFKFPQVGWLRGDNEITKQWLPQEGVTDETVLDELAPTGTLLEKLNQLNAVMAEVSPQRVHAMVSQTIRRDTQLVKALKEFHEFKCQFPNCSVRIPKHGGGWYIEVAHIKPVSKGGKSVLGNLLVLCPNHHKEIDYGNLELMEQTDMYLRGRLNGKEFEINLQPTTDKGD
jgi:hypothetical protein